MDKFQPVKKNLAEGVFFQTPLLDRRGGTNEAAPEVQANELACRRQVTGWWIICKDPTTPPQQIHFVHLSRHPSWPGGV